ncbi:EAL domain-containing protein [Psychromarinibacter sp. S121]|uniref:EAL domain-containing protein n=1 Tax=Psychromarinibacter sp. S121 TaxID=3415127 RepID=UPI003C7E4784
MVRDAIAHRNVLLAFQPVVQAAEPYRPAFWEGLIRILDSSGRVIPARDFINDVETTELGRQIDCLALELGLATLADHPGLRLSINMSARSIGYPRWTETLDRGLRRDPTVAERLILEITESSAMVMPDTVQVFMADMQHRGLSFALDDFGAGYTAFRYLREFYFDILKIDGQFIRNIHDNPDNQVLTQALISIARHFEMFTVAEYVETAEDAEFLSAIGIDCMQGYYFGAPTTRPFWTVKSDDLQVG